MSKTKKILLIAGVVLLVACLAVILAFCGKPGNSDPANDTVGSDLTYTVQIQNATGTALEGVGVYIYEDETRAELVWFDKTDAEGKISFAAPESDKYVAVLSNLPTGYVAEEYYTLTGELTQIVLAAGSLEDADPDELRYELGDMMMDFTIVDTEGTEYTLSELLKVKKAVVLNFWYIECAPCRMEFPFMQQAYELYKDDIEILALNPVNTSEEDIAAFKQENKLSFPMAMVDENWAQIMQLTAYPTTVVIDRYGTISLIHKGSIDNADTFEQLFDYFTSEDYVQKPIENLDEIVTEELGTAENPEQLGAENVKVTVKAGQEYHLEFYKVSGLYMTAKGEDFYVIYNGKKYEPTNGKVSMRVESEGIYYPVKITLGNTGKKDQTISISFGAQKGSLANPYSISLGEFSMNTTSGSEEGTYGVYTAEESGTLTVRCLHSSVSKYGFFLYNLRSYAMRNTNEDGVTDEDGYNFISVQVKKGDQVQFNVAVDRDENNFISAGSFQFELMLEEGDGEEHKKAEPPKTAYGVTVTDEEGNPLSDVAVNLKGEFTYEPTEEDPEDLEPQEVKVDLNLSTDEEGKITTEQVNGPYTLTVRIPEGYRLEQTQYELTAENPEVTVVLQKIKMLDYVVKVLDPDGNPVAGVTLMMGINMGSTDEQGIYTISMEEAEYTVFIIAGIPEEYLLPADSFVIEKGESELIIQLESAEEPEPEYTDIFGEFPIITGELAAGEKAYYNVYNAGGSQLVIEDADAYAIINEVTYEAVDGVVTAPVPQTMGRQPVAIVIGNGGTDTESYTVNFVYPEGSAQNPAALPEGDFAVALADGNSEGYYYTWTALEDGTLTVLLRSDKAGIAGEDFEVMLTNNTSYACPTMSESAGGKSVSVEVKAGEQVTVLVSNLADANWEYTAKTVELSASFSNEPIEPPHVHEYTAVVTAPTCTEKGYTTYTCACGDSYVDDEVPATGHKYEAVVTAPTCTDKGYTTYTCSACGHSYVGDEVPATGHKYEAVVTAPTCTEKGYTTYTCICGDSYVGDEVPATGHSYKAVVTAPTCTDKGYTTYTCVCGDSYVAEETEALGHDYSSTVIAPTTTSQGYTLHTCSRCGDSYKDNYTDKLPEEPDEPPHAHEYTAVVTAPNCTDKGYTTYTCACGDSYVADETEALGHNYSSTVVEPTTTSQGYTLHTCARCGDSYKDNYTDKLPEEPIEPPHVHEYTAVVTAPTCTDKGYTTYTCACGDSYVGDEVPATGHSYKAVVTAPNCTDKGYTTYTCSACGHSYIGDEVAATGHSYKAVVTAPNCTDKGYTTYTCGACGHSYIADEVAATGHSYKAVVTAPNCTDKGYTTYTCGACGHSYTAEETEALGHDYSSTVIEPTTTSEGYTLHTCSRCGDSYKDNYTDKLPEKPSTPDYTVTVTNYDGVPMAGVAVQILKNGAPVKAGITNAEGKFTAVLDPDTYQVKLAFATIGNHYEDKTAVLTAENPELQIFVTTTVPSQGVEDHWMLGKADEVSVGGTYVSIQKDVMTYFLFTPTEEGTYRFSTSDPAAILSYWGGENFPSNQTANTDYKDNVFTLSINQSYLGQSYVIGITGADDCILIIERQGTAAFNPNEVPYTAYQLAQAPTAFTVKESGVLTFVDLSGNTADYQLVLGSDGYYHIGTADGPIAYVCLGGRAPYVPLYTMCGGGGGSNGAPFRYTDYSDLDNIVKEDYTQCILDYGACMDSTYGVYPMTADLIHILQHGVKHQSWDDPNSITFQFGDVTDYNPELGWMFAVCYFK